MTELARGECNGRAAMGQTFLILAAVVVSSLAFIYFLGVQAVRTNREIVVRHDAIAHLNALLSAAKDAETGQRGYLLTRDPLYLEPYGQALKAIARERKTLRQLAADGYAPLAGIETLDALLDTKLAELDRTIAVSRTQGVGAAIAIVRAGAGRAAMEQIRALVGSLMHGQNAALSRLIAAADRAASRAPPPAPSSGFSTCLFSSGRMGASRRKSATASAPSRSAQMSGRR